MKKKYAFVVKVPKTEKGAYNHDRPISSLIEYQMKHLREAEASLPKARQTNIDISTLKTELQASKYIQKITAILHPQGAEKLSKVRTAKKAKKPIKVKRLAKRKSAKKR